MVGVRVPVAKAKLVGDSVGEHAEIDVGVASRRTFSRMDASGKTAAAVCCVAATSIREITTTTRQGQK